MKQKQKTMKQDFQEKNESMIITGWEWKERVSKLSTSLHNIAVAQLRAAWDFFCAGRDPHLQNRLLQL
jgi:hypothetical protein